MYAHTNTPVKHHSKPSPSHEDDKIIEHTVRLDLQGTVGVPARHRMMPETIEVDLGRMDGSAKVNEWLPNPSLDDTSSIGTPDSYSSTVTPKISPRLEPHSLWRIADAILTLRTVHITDISPESIEGFEIRGWGEPPREAVAIPIISEEKSDDIPAMVMIVGLNSRRPYDGDYATWIDVMRVSLGTMLTSVMVKEAEHKRAEQLSQLDAAKTLFFSNASHELRQSS